jgi:hypothetical protein
MFLRNAVSTNKTTRCQKPEDHRYIHCLQKLKSQRLNVVHILENNLHRIQRTTIHISHYELVNAHIPSETFQLQIPYQCAFLVPRRVTCPALDNTSPRLRAGRPEVRFLARYGFYFCHCVLIGVRVHATSIQCLSSRTKP